jgi:heme/copper-type cytochrome/quinol oxidase subunit 3
MCTGFHGAHVLSGVIYLVVMWLNALKGKYGPHNSSPVELVGLFWHFVDLVWIILFTIVYLF